jgi:cytochrome d ubiquinol oxidase subunit I
MAMLGLAALGMLLWWTGRLWTTRWFLWALVAAVMLPIIANQTGWIAAETGRQPWIVYPEFDVPDHASPDVMLLPQSVTLQDGTEMRTGLRTSEGLSRAVQASHVLASIIMFALIYMLLFWVWVWVINHKIMKGPEEPDTAIGPQSDGFLAGARASHGRLNGASGELVEEEGGAA